MRFNFDVRYTACTLVVLDAEDYDTAKEQVQGELEWMTEGRLDYYEIKGWQTVEGRKVTHQE